MNNNETICYIAGQIRQIRKERGFTQRQAAQALNLSRTQIQRYERMENDIPSSLLLEMSRLFKVSVHVFYPVTEAAIIDGDKVAILKKLLKSVKKQIGQTIDILE